MDQGRQAADARRTQGQLAGQQWTNLASIIGSLPGQLQAAKDAEITRDYRKAQGENLAAEGRLRDEQATSAKQGRIDAGTIDTILASGLDREQMRRQAYEAGNGHLWPQIEAALDKHDQSAASLKEATLKAQKATEDLELQHKDYLGGLAADVAKHEYAPGVFQLAIMHAYQGGAIDKQTAGQYIAQSLQNPEGIKQVVDAAIAASPSYQKAQATAQAERMKPVVLSEGSRQVANGETVAENPKPTAKVTYSRPQKMLVGGKPTNVMQGSDAKFYDTRFRPVTPDDAPYVTPSRAQVAKDNPRFPRGVEDFLYALKQQGRTRDEVEQQVEQTWNQLRRDHPNLSALEVQSAVNRLFPANDFGGGGASVLGGTTSPAGRATTTGPIGQPAAGGGQRRTASSTDVKAVAQRLGISEAEARKQLQAAGVAIQ